MCFVDSKIIFLDILVPFLNSTCYYDTKMPIKHLSSGWKLQCYFAKMQQKSEDIHNP